MQAKLPDCRAASQTPSPGLSVLPRCARSGVPGSEMAQYCSLLSAVRPWAFLVPFIRHMPITNREYGAWGSRLRYVPRDSRRYGGEGMGRPVSCPVVFQLPGARGCGSLHDTLPKMRSERSGIVVESATTAVVAPLIGNFSSAGNFSVCGYYIPRLNITKPSTDFDRDYWVVYIYPNPCPLPGGPKVPRNPLPTVELSSRHPLDTSCFYAFWLLLCWQ